MFEVEFYNIFYNWESSRGPQEYGPRVACCAGLLYKVVPKIPQNVQLEGPMKIGSFRDLASLHHGTWPLQYIERLLRCEHIIMVFNFRKLLLHDVKLLTMGRGTNSKSTVASHSYGQASWIFILRFVPFFCNFNPTLPVQRRAFHLSYFSLVFCFVTTSMKRSNYCVLSHHFFS